MWKEAVRIKEREENHMILGLFGVTGIGKSYYKDLLVQELNFEKGKIITTREPRVGEKNGEDKIFMSEDELETLRQQDKIAYEFELVGNTYAYTKDEIFSNRNMVFEMQWTTIYDWKKVCPNLRTIYLLPTDIEIPKAKTRERNLKPEVEKARLLEIDEHWQKITSDESLRNMFDYMMYNHYNQETDQKIIEAVKKMLQDTN